MRSRLFFIILALSLPIAAVLAIVYFASSENIAKKAVTPMGATVPGTGGKTTDKITVSTVPVTIEEARKRGIARLEEIKKMTQEEWDVERVKVAHRNPPTKLEMAIARAQLRVDDLNRMTAAEWENEKNILRERERRNIAYDKDQAENARQEKVQKLIDSVKGK